MGDGGLPVVGHSLAALADMKTYGARRQARYGEVSWGSMVGRTAVIVLGPDSIGEVLANRDRAFANGPGWGYFLGPFFTRGLMLLDFEEHLAHKRIMQQAFTRERLEVYLDGLNDGIADAMSGWSERRGFKLYDATKDLLLDTATLVLVGTELGADADRVNKAFVDTVAAGLGIVRHDVPGTMWHRGLVGRRVLEDYFRGLIPEKRATATPDLMSVLCHVEAEDGTRFSDEDVVNHMIFTLMAAHDTSTITSTTLAYHLARDPELQERLRQESLALGKERLDYADLDRLPLLDLAFKEALRLNPPVGGIVREAVKDTSILGHYVPEGTLIIVNIMQAQHSEEWWDEPERFDPERFLPTRRDHRLHNYQWSPFGGGVHKCIGLYYGGMQVKAILHHLLLNFRWSVPEGYDPVWKYGTGLYPSDGLPVRLERLTPQD